MGWWLAWVLSVHVVLALDVVLIGFRSRQRATVIDVVYPSIEDGEPYEAYLCIDAPSTRVAMAVWNQSYSKHWELHRVDDSGCLMAIRRKSA